MTEMYKSIRIIDRKPRWVIIDENRSIINKCPSKEELKSLTCPEKYSRCKYYTEVQLLEYLIQFHKDKGRIPTTADFDADHQKYPNPSFYTKKFGSWITAIVSAGLLKEDNYNKKYTDEQLLDYMRQFFKETDRIPMQNDFLHNPKYPSYSRYVDRLGGWNRSIKKAGLHIRNKEKKYTDEELLSCILKFKDKNGIYPTSTEFKNGHNLPSISTYLRRFGSWSNALKLVGLDVDTMVLQGVLETNQQKGRKAEIAIIKYLNNPIDLSGNKYNSHWDGICPNGMNYEVKSSGLRIGGYFQFRIDNKDREEIEIYYFIGFNEDYTKLLYGWRIPGEMVEDDNFHITFNRWSSGNNLENMKQYEITDMLRDSIKGIF